MSRSRTAKSLHRKNATKNSLRIIGGQWRGRKLSFADIDGLRPTGDRIRETLFNWLMPILPGARCLDLFAGSGALGLEALSRGASKVVMLDRERQVVSLLKQHADTLEAKHATIVEADAMQWLANQNRLTDDQQPYDIVFLDPPFDLDLWQRAVDTLEDSGLLNATAAIYIEARRNGPLAVPANWRLHKEKQSGQVNYCLYYRYE